MLTDKWVTVDNIIERIARANPELQIDRYTIAEWCFDVVKDLGVWPGFERVTIKLDVANKQAELPCNVYRVLQVRPNTSLRDPMKFGYENTGSHIRVSDRSISGTPTNIVVDALAFKVDENGLPMIFEPAARACHFYVLHMHSLDKMLSGQMPPDRFNYLEEAYNRHLRDARSKTSRWRSRDDMDRVVAVARSIIRPVHYAEPR